MHSPVDSMSMRRDDDDHQMPPQSPPSHLMPPPSSRAPRVPLRASIATGSSRRSRSITRATNTDSTILQPQTPSATAPNFRRPLPLNASSSHRPTERTPGSKHLNATPNPNSQQGGSSSSTAPQPNFMSTSGPLLPCDSDTDSLPSTVAEPSDLDARDFLTRVFSAFGDGGEPWQVLTNTEGEVVLEKLLANSHQMR